MPDYKHDQQPKAAVLLVNTGTPAAPTKKALRPYLKQFLSDRRIVGLPRLLWWPILNLIVLNTRPKKSAQAYKRIWTERGSPLAFYTADQAEGLREKLEAEWGEHLIVEWAMRYGNPSISDRLQSLQDQGVEKVLVLSLFPQYSSAATASVFDAVANYARPKFWVPEFRFINQYFNHPLYVEALADSLRQHWQQYGKAQKIIFSFHGEPLHYLHKGDPYHCQCQKTARLVAEQLNLKEDEYLTTFQSLFGAAEWLRPYTDETLKALPSQGIDHVQVICPGFSSDCLETIDEIAIENKEYFIEAGGKTFEYIPALNATAPHIEALHAIVSENLQGWEGIKHSDRSKTFERFNNHPHNLPK